MSARELARVTISDDGHALKEIIVRHCQATEYNGPIVAIAWRITCSTGTTVGLRFGE